MFYECMSAKWDELDAFGVAVNVGERIGLSDEARGMLATHPPLADVIERHRDALVVRSFLLDPELTFTLPG